MKHQQCSAGAKQSLTDKASSDESDVGLRDVVDLKINGESEDLTFD